MKFVLLFVALALHKSWQQDSSETINETLDKLIQQTDVVQHNDKNNRASKNNSNIYYYSQKQSEKDEDQAKGTSSNDRPTDLVSIAEILHALGIKETKSEDNGDQDNNKSHFMKEITFTVEKTMQPQTVNTDSSKENELLKNILSRAGRPSDNVPEETMLEIVSETENNLLHKYPEIIIDRITYHNNELKLNKEPSILAAENKGIDKQILAKELKSLLDELRKSEIAQNGNKIKSQNANNAPIVQDTEESTKPLCGSLPMTYLSPCNIKVFLNQILPDDQNKPQAYSRSGLPHIDMSLQLDELSARQANARQNAIMRLSMAHKLKRINFLNSNRRFSRFHHHPLYRYF